MKNISLPKRMAVWLYAIAFTALLAACGGSDVPPAPPTAAPEQAPEAATDTALPPTTEPTTEALPTAIPFQISSSGFAEGEVIPDRYACTGDNLSPELLWGDPPAGTESLALIFDDPDAPGGTWVHWVIFNIPPDQKSLSEGVAPVAEHPDGSKSGSNSWDEIGYGGPCPPQGSTHNYIFKLYALDSLLDLEVGVSKQELLTAMDGHILAETQANGLFSR